MTPQDWEEIGKPQHGRDRFVCPHCKRFQPQTWLRNVQSVQGQKERALPVQNFSFSQCTGCQKYAGWLQQTMIWPCVSIAPPPEANMPADVVDVYERARRVLPTSPEAAAAFLRVAIERLMPHLGETQGRLNDRIGSLVKKGLRIEVQQMLDIVRVIGNNAVHPGTIDLKDNPATAASLFKLVNRIVYDTITAPKELQAMYDGLPESAQRGIEQRDGKALAATTA